MVMKSMELSFKQKLSTIIFKLIVIISAIIGIILSAIKSDAFMGGSTVFMYFTIQSNILIAAICFIGLGLVLLKSKANNIWSVIKLVSTISITLTGLVFTFVLAPTLGNDAWSLNNVLTHAVVPVAAVIDFFIVGVHLSLKKKDVFFVVIPPLMYVIYAGIGYAADWKFTKTANYPYFFLNYGSSAGAFGFSSSLPYMGVVWWILFLLLLLIGLGFLYLKIIDLLKKKYSND